MVNVYVLQNEMGKIYVGQTTNLEQRLARHNKTLPSKSTSFTSRNKGEWKVVYKEIVNTRTEALQREKQLKSYQGRQFIKRIIQNMGR